MTASLGQQLSHYRLWQVQGMLDPAMQPMQHEQLGPYRVVGKLGQGGMGSVYQGVDEQGRHVAIKTLARRLSNQAGFRHRFELEIEALRKLEHPHIVRIYGFGEQQGILFYAMELIDGCSLEQVRQQCGKLLWREVVGLARQVCLALRHAHDRGIIHRDLKPANLMLTRQDQIKLSDFGIASMWGLSGHTLDGSVLGTAAYMSPEQADGLKATARSDLYSLGCVMYALLTGQPPFVSRSMPEVLRMHRTATPEPISRFAPDVPPELATVVLNLLEKDPQQRMANAGVVSRALQGVLDAVELAKQQGGGGGGAAPEQAVAHEQPTQGLQGAAEKDEAPTVDHGQVPASGPVDDPIQTQHTLPTITANSSAERGEELPTAPSVRPDDSTAALVQAATAGPAASEPQGAGPAEGSLSRSVFITADQADRQEQQDKYQQVWHSTVSLQSILFGVLFTAVVLLTLYLLRPPTADQLHARMMTLAEQADRLTEAEADVIQFLQRYPDDPRSDQVRRLHKQIELLNQERRLYVRARRLGRTQTETPIERIYLETVRLADDQPDAALARFEAMRVLFSAELTGPDADQPDQHYRELIDRQIVRLREQVREYAERHLAYLGQQLDQAAKLAPEKAQAIYEAIVMLYADKPWAAALVQQARDSLEQSQLAHGLNPAAD